MIPKPDKGIKITDQYFSGTGMQNSLKKKKKLANRIQLHRERIKHHNQVKFIPGMQSKSMYFIISIKKNIPHNSTHTLYNYLLNLQSNFCQLIRQNWPLTAVQLMTGYLLDQILLLILSNTYWALTKCKVLYIVFYAYYLAPDTHTSGP